MTETSRPEKRSHFLANLANHVDDLVRTAWPEICDFCDHGRPEVWFTGSRIWGMLYPDLPRRSPPLELDWDVFTVGEDLAHDLVRALGWNQLPACLTSRKWVDRRIIAPSLHVPSLADPSTGSEQDGYGAGFSYQTSRGVVDLWVSQEGSAFGELHAYRSESHAHCRAAYSPVLGLIVLPNDRSPGCAWSPRGSCGDPLEPHGGPGEPERKSR